MRPPRLADSRGGPLTTDRPTAENPGEKFDANGTRDQRQSHDHTRQVRGCLVVVVELPGEKYRRRTFLTLKAAERAVRRAEEAGHPASVVVAQLVPVAVVA